MASEKPYVIDPVDLGSGNGIGLGLSMDKWTESRDSVEQSGKAPLQDRADEADRGGWRNSEISVPAAAAAEDATLDTPRAPSTAQHGTVNAFKQDDDIISGPHANPGANGVAKDLQTAASDRRLVNMNPPPRPRRRRHEHSASNVSDAEGDLDVHLDAALNFVSRYPLPGSSNLTARLGAAHAKSQTGRRPSRDVFGPSAHETVRLRREFRRALSRITEKQEHGSEASPPVGAGDGDDTSDGMTDALAFVRTSSPSLGGGTSAGSHLSKGVSDGEADEVLKLLRHARLLSREPLNAAKHSVSPGSTTPPTEAVKRAINDPVGSAARHAEGSIGILTSASTPEGALGRIALPPVAWYMRDGEETKRVSVNDSVKEELIGEVDETPHAGMCAAAPKPSADGSETDALSDAEALRAGLRFVLSCYDDMSKRVRDNKGFSNAIIASIAEGRTYQPTTASSSRSRDSSESQRPSRPLTTDRTPRQRLRTGSILKALARGKAAMAIDSNKSVWGPQGSGLSSPFRSTQMDFDASPDNLVGPSNRLGMAQYVSWSTFDDQSSTNVRSPGERQRTLSNATSISSPAWHRNSHISQNGAEPTSEPDSSLQTSIDSETAVLTATLKHTQRELSQAQEEKRRLMSEMELLSEQLFTQANEMVKQERIKSSALEKELESLKLAMSNTNGGGTNDGHDGASNRQTDIEVGAQTESEATMMAAVAQASHECAEAEEEAEGWRKHCEELEARITILEEALYNSMALLADHEGELSLGEQADAWEGKEVAEAGLQDGSEGQLTEQAKATDFVPSTSGRASLVIPHKEFSESNSSFYSAGDGQYEDGVTSPLQLTEESPNGLTAEPRVGLANMPANEISHEYSGVDANKTPIFDIPDDNLGVRNGSFADGDVSTSLSQDVTHSSDPRLAIQISNKVDEKMPASTGNSIAYPSEPAERNLGPTNGHRVSSIEAGSAASLSSHRSSSHSGRTSSPRASSISSKRQSRPVVLPPRLPQPVSPLPNIPGNDDWQNSPGGKRANLPLETPLLGSRSSSMRQEQLVQAKDEITGTQPVHQRPLYVRTKSNPTLSPQSGPGNGYDSLLDSRKQSIATASTASSPMAVTPPTSYASDNRTRTMHRLSSTNNPTLQSNTTHLPQLSVASGLAASSPFSTYAFDEMQWNDQPDHKVEPGQEIEDIHSLQPYGDDVNLTRRHSIGQSTSDDSRSSNSSSLVRTNSVTLSPLRAFSRSRLLGRNRDASTLSVAETETTMDSKISASGQTDVSERKSTRGANSTKSASRHRNQGAVQRKSARNAILHSMPPALPRSDSVATSIRSGSIMSAGGSLDSDDEGLAQDAATRGHYARVHQTRVSGSPKAGEDKKQGFGRRRRFNEQSQKVAAGGY